MKKKAPTVRYWLCKSEPEAFSIADLAKKGEALWDGVRNYQVRNLLRDEVRVGDKALFYHSSTKAVGVVGEMEVVGAAVPDPLQFDRKSQYYDPKSSKESPRWLAVTVRYVQTFPNLVPLSVLRADPQLAGMRILERGNRLSITAVTKAEYNRIVQLGTTKR
jgi:predicted RNA-binding protein with PUA-like domain